MGRRRTKESLARDAWKLLFDFFISTRWHRDAVLERLGLTPNDSKALHSLDPEIGRSMRALAADWATDASTVTWVVDRLEQKGLVERRTPSEDRRVKLVVLTARGAEVRDEILREFHEPPGEIARLGTKDLESLVAVLEKVAPKEPRANGVSTSPQSATTPNPSQAPIRLQGEDPT
jgi:DNA-binding MarR family transcriptional regulator